MAPQSVNMAARSVNGVTLASLKRDASRSSKKFHSKWRHKSKFGHNNSSGFLPGLPIWARILVSLGIIMAVLFIVFFAYYTTNEYQRSKKDGKPINWKRVLWKSAKFSFFIWIPLYAYRLIRYSNLQGKKGAAYAEIDDDQQRLNNPTTTETKAWNAGTPSSDNEAKFEPMGYRSHVYDPYSAYAGVGLPSAETSPPTTAGLHQPPPMESGDLGARSPSPARADFASPSQPPPSYKNN